jgi:hypothetical protein
VFKVYNFQVPPIHPPLGDFEEDVSDWNDEKEKDRSVGDVSQEMNQ